MGQDVARRQELHRGLPLERQGLKILGHFSLPSQVHWQETGSRVGHLGLKLVLWHGILLCLIYSSSGVEGPGPDLICFAISRFPSELLWRRNGMPTYKATWPQSLVTAVMDMNHASLLLLHFPTVCRELKRTPTAGDEPDSSTSHATSSKADFRALLPQSGHRDPFLSLLFSSNCSSKLSKPVLKQTVAKQVFIKCCFLFYEWRRVYKDILKSLESNTHTHTLYNSKIKEVPGRHFFLKA